MYLREPQWWTNFWDGLVVFSRSCKSCHSTLIVADSLLPFTFLASPDMRNQPWFACQTVSISCAVRRNKTTPQWITLFTICQSFVLICWPQRYFLFFPPVYLLLLITQPECIHCLQETTHHQEHQAFVVSQYFYSIYCKYTFNRNYVSDLISPLIKHSFLEWAIYRWEQEVRVK